MAKKYKCRVEYLESTGTQWIDTGIAPSNITPIAKLKFIPTQQYSSGNYGIFGCFGANNTRFQVFYNSIGIGTYVSKSWQANTTYEVELNGKTPSATINGSVETSGYSNANGFSSDNMYLFTRNNGNVADNCVPLKLYYCKIWNNDVLVRDLIPVLDNSGRPAMYDQVSGQLFYNQGSGEFIYGRQIIPVEYLESTGTQYIDTGIKGKNNLRYKSKINFTTLSTSGSNGIGGEYLANASAYIGMVRANGHYTYLFNNTAVETTTTIYANTDYEIDSVMDSGNQVLKVNGETISTGTLSGTFTSTRNIFLYAICSTNDAADVYGSLKMYYCQIYDNDTLVRDFIPCIDENLTPFMFDKVQNTVYLNAGTGQFKVGPNVEKAWGGKKLRRKLALALANLKKPRKYYCEVEYLEGTGTQYIDTGLDYFADFEVGVQLRTSVSNKALGNGAFYCMQRYNQANPYWYFSTGTGTSNSYITSTPITEHHIMKWKDNKIYSDGVLLTDFTKDSNAPNRMYLYSGDGGNKYPNMIYFCKLWNPDNGELVRDFIPVLDWDMKPCLFDRVTEQLFYNQAISGNDFSYGREIHYVDYLESTGTQYIDTMIKSSANMFVKTKFNLSDVSAKAVFGSYSGSASNGVGVFFGTAGGNLSGKVYCNNTNVAVSPDLTLSTNTDYEIEMSGTTLTVNGSDYTSATTADNNYNMALFARSNNGTVERQISGKIYYFTIKDNGTLVRDYIPAIDENGVGYMLDRVSHTIYDNAGTGAFGYSGKEVEYLESDGARAIVAGVTVDDTCGYDVKWMALNSNDTIILGTKGSGDSRWVLSGGNNPNVNISWNTSSGGIGLGLNKIQTAQMNYFNDRKRILNDTPLTDITQTLSANASTYNVCIFAGYWGASTISLYSTCRIYYAKITKGTELIRDFIPMVKDGSPCLYDKVGGSYYFGTGTGTFSVGKIVEPEYE